MTRSRPYPIASILVATTVVFGLWIGFVHYRRTALPVPQGPVVTNTSSRPNILVVTLCSVRTDHLAYMGGPRSVTPTLDALATNSAVFEDAWSNGTFTLAAHASLLTGMLPGPAGLIDAGDTIEPSLPVLPEVLRLYGYRTLANAPPSGRIEPGRRSGPRCLDAMGEDGAEARDGTLRSTFGPVAGQERGFDHFFVGPQDACESTFVNSLRGTTPFFAIAHIKDAHSPYGYDRLPPEQRDPRLSEWMNPLAIKSQAEQWAADARFVAEMKADPALRQRLNDLYDGALGRTDAALGSLLTHLQAAGLLRNTVVVVLGDHGESLGETEVFGHAGILGPQVLQVPMLVQMPSRKGSRISTPVSTVDLMPTLLALAEAPPPAGLQGRNLLPTLRGESLPVRLVIAQANARDVPISEQEKAEGHSPLGEALINDQYLLRYLPDVGLSHLWRRTASGLKELPGETGAVTAELLRQRREILGDWRARDHSSPPLTASQLQQMHQNGYW